MIDPHDEIKIREFVSDLCHIRQLKRIGEPSSEAKIYLLDCFDKSLKVSKVSKESTSSLKYEISLMTDKYIIRWRICPQIYMASDDIIIMEYIPMTLSRWLADLLADVIFKRRFRSLHQDFTRVIDSLVDKLFKFHQRYIHSDLHSNNVLVNPETLECFIIDFQKDGNMDMFANLQNLQESFYIYTVDIMREYDNAAALETTDRLLNMFSTMFKDKVKKTYL